MEFFVPAGNGAADNSNSSHDFPDHHHPTSSSSSSSSSTNRPTQQQHQYHDDDSPPAATHSTADDKLAWLQQNLGAHMMDGANGSLTNAELEAALAAMPRTLLPLLYTLTTEVRSFQEQNTELMFDVKKHRAEAERLMQERASLCDKVDVAHQDRQAAESMLASMRAETAALERRWSEEKNELNARLTRLTWKDLTIRAQLKKKDVEYEKLQKQLTRSTGSSSGSKTTTGSRATGNRVRSVDITPKPSAYSGISGSNSSGSALVGDEASRAALAASDHRQTLLLEENAELRETLRCLYAEIQGLQDQYGDLMVEVDGSRVRHHEELAKARGAAGASSPLPSLGGEDESIFFPHPTSRRFEEGAFEMPAEWLGRVVGEELRADMVELGRRYDRLREVVMGQQQQQQQQEEEEAEQEEIAEALRELAKEKKALQREVRRVKARLHETEEVVAMQEVVIKGALFGEEAGHAGRRSQGGGEGRRRLSADSWMAENEQMEEPAMQREMQQQQQVEEEEGGTLEELAEKLTADLMRFGMEDEQQDIAAAAAAAAAATAAALGFTPSKKVIADGEWKATRTPLRTLSGGGGNLLSPMLQARMADLDKDMQKHSGSSSSSSSSREEGLNDGTPRGRCSLQEALGLLSPIEHHHHAGENRHHSGKKTL